MVTGSFVGHLGREIAKKIEAAHEKLSVEAEGPLLKMLHRRVPVIRAGLDSL